MNTRIQALVLQSGLVQYLTDDKLIDAERFAQLLQQAIYDEIKQELIPEELIDAEAKIEDRFYLRGCNGGIVDALTIVKNFGVEP